MVFTLRDIPTAMRAEGWEIGAKVMERWFARPARAMSKEEKSNDRRSPDIETRLVTMGWARGFSRVASAEQRLLATWSNPTRLSASRQVLEKRVRHWRQRHATGDRAFRFGNLSAATAEIDATSQINIEKVDSAYSGTVDDFYAAIGNCTLKIAVSGMVTALGNNRLRLVIDEVGTYLRDTYDFIDDQGLGGWGPSGLRRAALLAPDIQIVAETARERPGQAFWSVGNGSFRQYRAHYGRGGDFVIFTDIRRQCILPVTVEIGA